jgi:hypothetical protein
MKVAWGIAALLLVAGCGGAGPDTGSAAKPAQKPAKQLDSAAAIGKLIGCRTPLKVDTESMAQEERYCKVGNHLVSIVRASDRRNLLAYARMGEAFGANVALVNDHWGVSSESRDLVKFFAHQNHWQML